MYFKGLSYTKVVEPEPAPRIMPEQRLQKSVGNLNVSRVRLGVISHKEVPLVVVGDTETKGAEQQWKV